MMRRISYRALFFSCFVLVACAFLLPLWVSGHKPQEKDAPRRVVSGSVTQLNAILTDVKNVSSAPVVTVLRVPVRMYTRDGEESMLPEQQELYVLLSRYFGVHHIMVRIAACESRLMHTRRGRVVVGEITPDVGLFQINPVHHAFMRGYGLDPGVLEHNIAFAKYLFDRSGVMPWMSSHACWADFTSLRFLYPKDV